MNEQQCTLDELVKELNKITKEKGYGDIAKLVLFTPKSTAISYICSFSCKDI